MLQQIIPQSGVSTASLEIYEYTLTLALMLLIRWEKTIFNLNMSKQTTEQGTTYLEFRV